MLFFTTYDWLARTRTVENYYHLIRLDAFGLNAKRRRPRRLLCGSDAIKHRSFSILQRLQLRHYSIRNKATCVLPRQPVLILLRMANTIIVYRQMFLCCCNQRLPVEFDNSQQGRLKNTFAYKNVYFGIKSVRTGTASVQELPKKV